jgi:hypothetical protein
MIIGHNLSVGLAFYNDRVKEIIAADIIAEPFTFVPIIAGHMELVGGNALVFGKITEGYDIIALDVDVEIAYKDVGSVTPEIYLTVTPRQTGQVINVNPGGPIYESRTITAVLVITLPSKVYIGSTYFVNVVREDMGTDLSVTYVAQAGDTLADVKAALEYEMGIEGISVASGSAADEIYIEESNATFSTDPWEEGDETTIFQNYDVKAYISAFGFATKHPILKCGAKHQFGIVYKDRGGRTCSVIKNDSLAVYLPFYAEELDNKVSTEIALTFKINHKPPAWAESYEIVYFGNVSMDYWLQIRADNITLIPTSNGNRFSLNIQNTLEWTWNQNNRWKVPAYVWQAGDRLRLIGTVSDVDGAVSELYSGVAIGDDFATSPYDYEIEATGTQYNEEAIGGDWLIFQAVDRPEPFAGEDNILVEVYRPRKGLAQMTAYGTGMVFEIATDEYGNRYHEGNVDQVFDINGAGVSPAEVVNTANDAWKFIRINYQDNASNIIYPFWAESIFPSDWWSNQIIENKLTSCGFPFLDDLSQRQQVLDERIRHGGYLITGTRTNNIAHFTYEDFMDFPKKNGDINGLREVGFTLKVIQMYKETSVYINRIQTFNPDGTEQFALTDKFLAEQRPMEADFGCQHPDSIMVNGRNLYYWDNSQGVFIRSSPNGQIVLDTKMKRWYKDLVRWIQTHGGREALQTRTGANNDHDEVWVTWRCGSETRGLIFSESSGRYISEIDQPTESYLHLGNFFAHLYRQCLWIMNIDEGQEYLKWSGGYVYADVEIVSNVEPNKNKIFNSTAVFTDHLLQSLTKTVVIPEEASAVNEIMESNIPIFERKEGVYFGKIMKDENSKGNFATVLARKLNGREMRGRYCFVKLRTEEHDEKVRIDSIVVFSTPSERNI